MSDAAYTVLMRAFCSTLELGHNPETDEPPLVIEYDGAAYYFEPANGDNLLLYSFPGVLPAGKAEEGRRELLAANSFFNSTGGCTLGADPVDNRVVIQKLLPCERMTVEDLILAVENFAAAAGVWRKKLAELSDPENGEAAAPVAGHAGAGGMIRA